MLLLLLFFLAGATADTELSVRDVQRETDLICTSDLIEAIDMTAVFPRGDNFFCFLSTTLLLPNLVVTTTLIVLPTIH